MTGPFGFITGTGFYTLPNIEQVETETVETPYGSVEVQMGTLQGNEVAFIARHGTDHSVLPGDINYRANIYALYLLGVGCILSTSVCGSLVETWGAGALVLVDQFLDFTSGRADTFYPLDGRLAHVDVTDPYCATLHRHLREQSEALDIELQAGGTYACFNGPRFETRAEIEMVRRLGGHLVGMTNYPECVLARELEMCYATVGVVSNHAAGIQPKVTVAEVEHNLQDIGDTIAALFERVVLALPKQYDCACRHALDEALI